jgi:hypothetical protein
MTSQYRSISFNQLQRSPAAKPSTVGHLSLLAQLLELSLLRSSFQPVWPSGDGDIRGIHGTWLVNAGRNWQYSHATCVLYVYIYMYISHIRYKNWELGIYIYSVYIYIHTHSCIADKNWEGSCVILCRTTHIQLILYLLYSISHAQPITAHRLPSTPPALQLPDEAFGVPGARRQCFGETLGAWPFGLSSNFGTTETTWNNMKQSPFLKHFWNIAAECLECWATFHTSQLWNTYVVFQPLPISLRQLAMLPELASSFKKTSYLIRMQA